MTSDPTDEPTPNESDSPAETDSDSQGRASPSDAEGGSEKLDPDSRVLGPEGDPEEEHKEPSLGPACLVISILGLAVFSAVCGIGSFLVFSDQYPLAVKAINVQLIPWIESSRLSTEDKTAIVGELETLLPVLEERSIDKQQLTRLRNCLMDNPVLLWGEIEFLIAQAPNAGLTETEQVALERISQRLLRAAAERKLSRNDLEFTIQNCSKVREKAQSLEVLDSLSAEQIREFMQKAERILDRNGIPNEPYDKTPSEAFSILIDAALTIESE